MLGVDSKGFRLHKNCANLKRATFEARKNGRCVPLRRWFYLRGILLEEKRAVKTDLLGARWRAHAAWDEGGRGKPSPTVDCETSSVNRYLGA